MSNAVALSAGLLDRLRNRNQVPDPNNPGQTIPRERPVMKMIQELIKNGLSNWAPQFGQLLMPMLLEKLPGLLEGLFGGAGTADAEAGKIRSMVADLQEACGGQASVAGASISAVERGIWETFVNFIVEAIDSLDPADAMEFVVDLLKTLLERFAAAAEENA